MDQYYYDLIKTALPSVITAFVSIFALVLNYKSSKRSIEQSTLNNFKNMNFNQKEKIADQIVEKSSILLTKSDPNVLNSLVNEINPRPLTHDENTIIRKQLLAVSDEIQTISNVIKLLAFSILDKDNIAMFEDLSNSLDKVVEHCNKMILDLVKIYASMTPEGQLLDINPMEKKMELERVFSEIYPTYYIEMHVKTTEMVQRTRQKAISE